MAERFQRPSEWRAPSRDPNDQQFGDIVDIITIDQADKYDIALVGEPYDEGHIVGRPGARQGPKILREVLAGIKTHHRDNGPVISIGDLGDIRYTMGQTVAATLSEIKKTTRQVHKTSLTPVFLGGDHSLAYANIAPLLNLYDSVGVVNLDSHTDVREFIDGQPHTGTPFRQLIKAGLDAYVQVGARQFGLSTPYVDYADNHEVTTVTAESVGRDLDRALQTVFDAVVDVEALYISFDVDVLDTMTAPGTSSTEPGGLLSREVNQLLNALTADDRVAGVGVYEFSPMLDDKDVTGIASGRAVAHAISGLQQR